jgi:hypothetical protein
MNGLLGTDMEDPRTQGLLGTALAMLAASGPSPQRTTFGQILGHSGQAGMRQHDQARILKQRDEELRRRNAFDDLKLKMMQQAQSQAGTVTDPAMPSSIREWEYFSKLPQEQQSRYLEMKRQMYQVGDIAGVPSLVGRSPGMATQPLSTLQGEMSGQAAIAGAKQTAQEQAKANFDLTKTYDPATQRDVLRPRADLLPRIPPVQSAAERARLQQGVLQQEGAQDSPYAKGPSGQPLPMTWGGVPAGPSATEDAQAKAAAKRMTEAPQKIKAMESAIDRSGVVLSKIDEAIKNTSAFTAGTGSTLDFIPGTPARNYKGTIDTIIANIGFKELQNMRFESPTGGALGQVAVQELVMLQAVLSSLDRAQGPSQMKKNLGEIKSQYESAMEKMRRAIKAEKHFIETGTDIGQSDPLGIRQ